MAAVREEDVRKGVRDPEREQRSSEPRTDIRRYDKRREVEASNLLLITKGMTRRMIWKRGCAYSKRVPMPHR